MGKKRMEKTIVDKAKTFFVGLELSFFKHFLIADEAKTFFVVLELSFVKHFVAFQINHFDWYKVSIVLVLHFYLAWQFVSLFLACEATIQVFSLSL